jgi:tubulin---tyrosine ligase
MNDGILFPYLTRQETNGFSVIEFNAEYATKVGAMNDRPTLVHLGLNCEYTRGVVNRCLNRRQKFCKKVSGDVVDHINMDIQTDTANYDQDPIIQIADFENIQWEMVMTGKHRASSYLVRKGLSRKAQLALQIKRYTAKHPNSILKTAFPETMIIETWGAFEDVKVDFGMGTVADFGNCGIQASLRERLTWCVEEYKNKFSIRKNYTFDIHYDDGDKEEGVEFANLRTVNNINGKFCIGDKIEANYRGGGCWYPGKIIKVPEEKDNKQTQTQEISQRWILKPSVTNKGADIFLCKNWEMFIDSLEEKSHVREWVLQSYIERPLLCCGYKFHLRVYILCVGALQVYVFDDILMLLAAHKYEDGDTTDIYAHLTNTARAVEDINFSEKLFVKTLDDLPYHMSTEYPQILEEAGGNVKLLSNIRKKIHKITKELFCAFENEYTVFSPMANCFELYGLDFMVDEELNVSFLEANPGPDFKQTGGRLKKLIMQLWEQTLTIVVDQVDPLVNAPTFTKVYDQEASVSKLGGGLSFN